MRKLNNNEIQTLSKKIFKELNVPSPEDANKELKDKVQKQYEKNVESFNNSKEGKILQKYNVSVSAIKAIKEINNTEITHTHNTYNSICIKGYGVVQSFRVRLLNANSYPTVNDIKDDIVLAQIETTDLKDLIEKVKSNYQ